MAKIVHLELLIRIILHSIPKLSYLTSLQIRRHSDNIVELKAPNSIKAVFKVACSER
jgi:hypothetical protein